MFRPAPVLRAKTGTQLITTEPTGLLQVLAAGDLAVARELKHGGLQQHTDDLRAQEDGAGHGEPEHFEHSVAADRRRGDRTITAAVAVITRLVRSGLR